MKKIYTLLCLPIFFASIFLLHNTVFAAGSVTAVAQGNLKESVFGTVIEKVKFSTSVSTTSDVVINIITNGQCTFSGYGSGHVTSGSTYLYGPNGSVYTTFKAIDDNIIEGSHPCSFTYTTSSDDPAYEGLSGDGSITIEDNDATPGLTATSTPSSVSEGGESTQYVVMANDDTTDDVSVLVSTNGQCLVGAGGVKGGGDPYDFKNPREYIIYKGPTRTIYIYIKAVDDSIVEGDHTCTISATATSADPNYNNKPFPTLNLKVIDNDKVAEASNSTTTTTSNQAATGSQPATQVSGEEELEDKKEPLVESSLAKNLTINGIKIKDIKGDSPKINHGESVKLSGYAEPDSTLKLYIFSNPREATVTTDKDGYWEYEVEGIEPGDHHVEIAQIDEETGEEKDRTTIANFSVLGSSEAVGNIAQSAPATSKNNSSLWLIVGGVVVLVAASVGGYFWWRIKKRS